MRYDPNRELDVEAWFELDEEERISAVMDYHRRARIKLPNLKVHAVLHTIVENQAALGADYPVAGKLEQLMGEGLDRHEAVHAIGSVLARYIFEVQQGRITEEFNEAYLRDLAALSVESWHAEFG